MASRSDREIAFRRPDKAITVERNWSSVGIPRQNVSGAMRHFPVMELSSTRRFQFSIRSLLVVTAVLALALVPVAWVMREREQMRRMQISMHRAREEAIRAVLLAEQRRVEMLAKGGPKSAASDELDPSVNAPKVPQVTPEILIEHLRRENNELKDTVDSLRLEVQRLRAATGR